MRTYKTAKKSTRKKKMPTNEDKKRNIKWKRRKAWAKEKLQVAEHTSCGLLKGLQQFS